MIEPELRQNKKKKKLPCWPVIVLLFVIGQAASFLTLAPQLSQFAPPTSTQQTASERNTDNKSAQRSSENKDGKPRDNTISGAMMGDSEVLNGEVGVEIHHSVTDFIYDGVTWETPKKSVIAPVIDAVVLPPIGLVVNGTGAHTFGKWYWEDAARTASTYDTMKSSSSLMAKKRRSPNDSFPGLISLVQIYSNHFQHIIFDTIPKLAFVCPFLLLHPDLSVLVMNKLQMELVGAACPHLADSKNKFIFLSEQQPVYANVVYIPYHAGKYQMGIVPPGSVRPLGVRKSGRGEGEGSKVFYFARKQGTTRSVKNEKDVINAIQSIHPDMVVLYPSNDWKKDREYLSDAELIVGPHGGAMSNMVFALPNATVVEFIPLKKLRLLGENERPCYAGLAHGLGFTYYTVEPTSFNFDNGPMVVPTDKLQQLLLSIKETSLL